MRLLGLIFSIGVLSLIALTTVRFWGQGQSYKPFQTPYFAQDSSSPETEIIVAWEQAFLIEKYPHLILWADIYKGNDDSLIVRPWIERNTPKTKRTGDAKTDATLASSATRPLLKDLLAKYPNTRFVINCDVNQENIHQQLNQAISDAKATERVLLQSEYNTILESAKELMPMMIYGSTIADLTRIKTMAALWLLPAAPFKSDVLFVPLQYRKRATIDRDIVLEMKRRFKKVFIGPLANKKDVDQARALGADGLFVDDPFLVLGAR